MRIHLLVFYCVLSLAVPTRFLIGQASAGQPLPTSSAVPQKVAVSIGGDVPHPYTATADTLAALPRRTVRAADHGQPEASYEGVALTDLLARAGAPLGPSLRGAAMATYVLVSAADGYRVVFALAELDSHFTDRVIILADHKNGQPLNSREGPVRIVVPAEKRPARWARAVVAISVRHASD